MLLQADISLQVPGRLEHALCALPWPAREGSVPASAFIPVLLDYKVGSSTQCLHLPSSRKGVVETASHLAKVARPHQFSISGAQQEQLHNAAAAMLNKTLQQTLPAGIGFHHAALEPQDRAAVEELFRSRMIAVGSSEAPGRKIDIFTRWQVTTIVLEL